jgi:hypothetical protein
MPNLNMAVEKTTPLGPSPASVGTDASAAALAAPVSGPATLDELAALTADELQVIYGQAATPTIAEVAGDLRGRMLAFNSLGRGLFARALRAFAGWRFFPWRGKSFAALGPDHGEGINRVFGDRRPRKWFRFETKIGPSRAGAFDAFHLDYDNPGNPFYIRAIKDEIRRVRPGLYLGQAYLVTSKRARLVLYFGLSASSSSSLAGT